MKVYSASPVPDDKLDLTNHWIRAGHLRFHLQLDGSAIIAALALIEPGHPARWLLTDSVTRIIGVLDKVREAEQQQREEAEKGYITSRQIDDVYKKLCDELQVAFDSNIVPFRSAAE